MSDAYVGEIRMFAGNFAPVGWVLCDGRLLPIQDNDLLFALIGTTYGGNGQTNFAVPDLRGRIPIHFGKNPETGTTYDLAASGGAETVMLTVNQMAAHTHIVAAQEGEGTLVKPENAVWASSTLNQYTNSVPNASMASGLLTGAGGSAPHDNMMPYLAVNFIIATEGLYPSRP